MSTDYNARVELDTRADIDTLILDALAPYHPATSRSPQGRVEVTITVPAADFAQAAQTTVAVFARALDAPILAIEIMPTDEFDRRIGLAPIPDLVSVTEAAALAGVTRQAILQRLESGSLAGRKVGTTWAVQRDHLTAKIALK